MYFVTLVYKNVTRRRTRTWLTVLGLSTAVAAVVAFVGIANGFARSFRAVYESHGVDLVVSRKGAADRLSSAMDDSIPQRLSALPQIESADGLLIEAMSLEEDEVYGVPTVGMTPDSSMLRDFRVIDGRTLHTSDVRSVLLGSQIAKRLDRGVGDQLAFFEGEEYEVVGVVESYSIWENGSIIMPMSELQRLSDRGSQVTFVNVKLTGRSSRATVDEAIAAIHQMDNKLSAMPTRDFVETDTRIRLAEGMSWMTSSVALMIGAMGMLNTMMTMVHERKPEIGMLRAMGWRRGRVVRMILLEAAVLSLAAAVLGSMGGLAITTVLSQIPAVAGTISPYIDWRIFLLGCGIALGIGLMGAAYPAILGARLMPTTALRSI